MDLLVLNTTETFCPKAFSTLQGGLETLAKEAKSPSPEKDGPLWLCQADSWIALETQKTSVNPLTKAFLKEGQRYFTEKKHQNET